MDFDPFYNEFSHKTVRKRVWREKKEYCYILKIYKLIVETIKDIKNLAKEILENF